MVMDIEPERLVLHLLALALDEAKRVYDHAPSADDRRASEYPFEDELDALAPVVALGFGPIESARGEGFAAGAVAALIEAALAFGAESVVADTTLDNFASQKTMLRAGMSEVSRGSELIYFEAR